MTLLTLIAFAGRGHRIKTAPVRRMRPLASQIADDLLSSLSLRKNSPGRIVFFGHGIGALLALEVAKLLEDSQRLCVNHLIVSQCRAPHVSIAVSKVVAANVIC